MSARQTKDPVAKSKTHPALTMWQTLSTLSTSLTLTQLSGGKCDSRRRHQRQGTMANQCISLGHNNAEMLNRNSTNSSSSSSFSGNGNGNMLPLTVGAANTRRCCCQVDNRKSRCGKSMHRGTLHCLIFVGVLLLSFFCDATEATLRNVNLLVQPPAVRRGQSVTLRCDYQLDGAPLYSIKFYRGQMEFYRYTPGEYPHTKVFQYPGIRVDESSSNATLVVIRNVGFGLSGNFSCEVTADAPLYSTATTYAQMQVVEFPEKRPQLFTEHMRYEPGAVLRANCSTPPSRPRAELRFAINNIPINTEETQYIRTLDNLIASRLSLNLQLKAVHFVAAINGNAANAHMTNALDGNIGFGNGGSVSGTAGAGGLLLRCTAQIGDLYQEYKEIELGTPQKDPVPARVTLSSSATFRNILEAYFSRSAARRLTASDGLLVNNLIWCLSILLVAFGRS